MAIYPDDVRITLQVATVATLICLVVGGPLAWVLARYRFPGQGLLTLLVTAPIALPPTVVGYYLLRGLGHGSPFGRLLDRIGLELVFTWQGAVVAAAVLAAPLFIIPAQAGFASVDQELERVAATLGRSRLSIFLTITLPIAARNLWAGVVLAFAKAVGEFGATVMVAGAIPGRTRTMAVSVYDAIQAGDLGRANATALALLGISLASLSIFAALTTFLRR
jgi:molybdate transport system permease protein